MLFRRVIGNNIRTKRLERNLTIEELSEILNITPGFLGLIERGKRGTNLENLCKIKEFFDVTLDELVSESNNDPKGLRNDVKNKKDTIMGYLNLMEINELEYLSESIKNYFNYIKEV